MINKNLEDLFNLPVDVEENTLEEAVLPIEDEEPTLESISVLEKINQALPRVKGLTAADKEMDSLSEEAVDSYKSLMDYGMSVDPRFASDILGSASQFLGHAITAKTAKINKKLKMLDLQLKAAKLTADADGQDLGTADGTLFDRNEILNTIIEQAKMNNNK